VVVPAFVHQSHHHHRPRPTARLPLRLLASRLALLLLPSHVVAEARPLVLAQAVRDDEEEGQLHGQEGCGVWRVIDWVDESDGSVSRCR